MFVEGLVNLLVDNHVSASEGRLPSALRSFVYPFLKLFQACVARAHGERTIGIVVVLSVGLGKY